MNGCVAAISVDTGKVLDIEVICRPTVQHVRLQTALRNFEYESSKADHICHVILVLFIKNGNCGDFLNIFRSEKPADCKYTNIMGWRLKSFFLNVKDTYS
ncbi:hypothetical protein TNCV_3930571 [Trichonephila clavipes]|nr:hypothetical protein TNCV_3930571 [Trichonephila clavipes]